MKPVEIQGSKDFSKRSSLAFQDLLSGLRNWRIWLLLAWQDIRLRYRRSTLGPFWITLSMAVTIYTTGFLYGKLLNVNLAEYYPYFASGMLLWSLISISLTEGTSIFVESESFLKQMKQPYTTFIFRVVARNTIIFLHNVVIFVPIVVFYRLPLGWVSFLGLLGLFLVMINAVSFGMVLALFGTRFRDITQVINSLIQVIFFLTPIMWSPAILPERYHFAVHLNPVAQFIEMVRNPLLGIPPSTYAVMTTLGITAAGLLFSFFVFARFRDRITYWL